MQQNFEKSLYSILGIIPAPFEIIVIIDGETTKFDALLKQPNITKLVLKSKGGPAKARNTGARIAKGDILCFIDSDIIIPKNLLKKVALEFEHNPTIAAIFGSYDDEPGKSNFLSQYRNLIHHYVHQSGKEEAFTFWSGFGAIRKEVFEKMNGFDEVTYPKPSIEDIDLGYRLKKAGYRIKLCKDLQVKHLKRWTAWSMVKVDFFNRALPWTNLILNNKQIANDLNLKTKDRIAVTLVFILIINCLFLFWLPALAYLIPIILVLFLSVNRGLIQFFYQKKGLLFTIRVIPWNLIFYFISGLAFLTGAIYYFFAPKNNKFA